MKKLLGNHCFWPSIATNIGHWRDACLECQSSKVGRHTKTAPQVIPMPKTRFSHVHIDLVGPLTPSSGFRYILTMVDRFTRWPEALFSCKYVFLRKDATKAPLERPYTGPYLVLARNKYTVKIDTQNGPVRVSIQRVKPANVDPHNMSFHLPRKRGRPPKVRPPTGGE